MAAIKMEQFVKATRTIDAIDAAIASDGGNRFRELLMQHLPRIEDAYRQDDEADPFRSHLGLSLLGRKCDRELWLGWRWATMRSFPPRILRLFNRGHQEEARFLAMLEMIGVQFYQPEGGGQERVEHFGGHIGSALDGLLWGVPDCPGEWILGEFKTHATKPFSELTYKGVQVSKPEHYSQVQTTMIRRGVTKCLYLAVNKNDDDLFGEIITLDPAYANRQLYRGEQIVVARAAPPRLNNDPSHIDCTICDKHQRCHFPEQQDVPRNCRTCKHSVADPGGTWGCELHNKVLDKAAQLAGCGSWEPIGDLIRR